VWGRRESLLRTLARVRFTPTRVGTTARHSVSVTPAAVHPHACGDDDFEAVLALLQAGSPPRVWGRRPVFLLSIHPIRFTPTRVGTTSDELLPVCSLSVHPHACGDDRYNNGRSTTIYGSPPRVWGRRTFLSGGWLSAAVHPHACGDDGFGMIAIWRITGSPPRVWGRRQEHPRLLSRRRFTPTRVGTTGSSELLTARSSGSPPRVWGRLPGTRREDRGGRFTPTRVGTTIRGPNRPPRSTVHPHACGDD